MNQEEFEQTVEKIITAVKTIKELVEELKQAGLTEEQKLSLGESMAEFDG